MNLFVKIIKDQGGQFWSTFGSGLSQGVNHALDIYQKKKAQDQALKLQQAQLDELTAKTEERKQGQALRQRFTETQATPVEQFQNFSMPTTDEPAPIVATPQGQPIQPVSSAQSIQDFQNIGAKNKDQAINTQLQGMFPKEYATQKFKHDMPTSSSSSGQVVNESLMFNDMASATAYVKANPDGFPYGADYRIDNKGHVIIAGTRQALGSGAATQQKYGQAGLLNFNEEDAARRAAASTGSRVATEATAGREDIPPYQAPRSFTGQSQAPVTPQSEPRYYDPALPPEITGPLQQQGYQPAPAGYQPGPPRQSQINPGQPAPQHVPPTPAQPGHVSPGMTPAPAKSTSTSLPTKDPKESWVAYNARVKATVTRQEGHMSQEEQNAVIGHTDALTAAHQLNSFTPEEIDAFTGIISRPTQSLNRLATEIPYVRAFSDPKMAQRFSQFQQLSSKINLGIFTLGGKQLTPYEGSVVKGFIPTGEESSTIEWREKMNGFEAFTRAARDIRAKLAASGRGNIPLDELDGIMRRELSGVYGMPQNSTDQYITDPASGITYRKTKEGAVFRTQTPTQ